MVYSYRYSYPGKLNVILLLCVRTINKKRNTIIPTQININLI